MRDNNNGGEILALGVEERVSAFEPTVAAQILGCGTRQELVETLATLQIPETEIARYLFDEGRDVVQPTIQTWLDSWQASLQIVDEQDVLKQALNLAIPVSEVAGICGMKASRFAHVVRRSQKKIALSVLGEIFGVNAPRGEDYLRLVAMENPLERAVPLGSLSVEELLKQRGVAELDQIVIKDVINQLKFAGGKQWLTGSPEVLLDTLLDIYNGRQVDLLVWNCLEFAFGTGEQSESEVEQDFSAQQTRIQNTSDVALVDYFKAEIASTLKILSKLGNVQLVILIPTHEAFADGLGIWNYSQSLQEREAIVKANAEKIRMLVEKTLGQSGVPVSVVGWDNYLESRGVADNTNDLTVIGGEKVIQKTKTDTKFARSIDRQARSLFQRDYNDKVFKRQCKFLGVYAGEGLVSQNNMIGSQRVLWLNYEGAGVKEAQFVGAGGEIAILTPVLAEEIQKFYEWKRRILSSKAK